MSASAAPPAGTELRRIRLPLLASLALLSAVAPFAIDLYLPAFPAMIDDLGTTPTGAQFTLTAFFLGVTVGQLVFGPLSDRFGRYPPLLAGIVLCIVASAVAVAAPTIEVLVLARIAQGLGGAAGSVIARAIVADLSRGREAARNFSLMMVIQGIAPIVAPVLGGVFAAPLGWRGLLGIVLGLTCLMLATTLATVRETYPAERRTADRAAHAGEHAPLRALISPAFLGHALTFALAFATMAAYIAASPFLYQSMIGFSELGSGVAFGINASLLVAMTWVNARLTARHSLVGLVRTGLAIQAGAVLVFVLLVLLQVPPIWLALPLMPIVGSLGLIFGNVTALALSTIPRSVNGRASAVLGATQFGLGAVVSPLVGVAGQHSAVPLAATMAATALGAVLALSVARRAVRRAAQSSTSVAA